MKLRCLSLVLALASLALASSGCRDRTILLPTDEAARQAAIPQPPPPIGMGGPVPPPLKPGEVPTKVQLRGAGGSVGGGNAETKPAPKE